MITFSELKKRLPHRYPMLMIDRIEELSPDKAVGWKHVSINEPYFRGHFPNAPVMPGVLVIEALCQLVWVWLDNASGIRLTGIRKLRFRKPTVPGDCLRLEIEKIQGDKAQCTVRAIASVDGQQAVTGDLIFSLER